MRSDRKVQNKIEPGYFKPETYTWVEWFSVQGSRLKSPNHRILNKYCIHNGGKAFPPNG